MLVSIKTSYGFKNALAVEQELGYLVDIVRLDNTAAPKIMAQGETDVMLVEVETYWKRFEQNAKAHEDFFSMFENHSLTK